MYVFNRLFGRNAFMFDADDGTGGGGGGDAAAIAAKAAADKAAADAAKAAADEAAAAAAAAKDKDEKLTDKEAALLKDVMKQKEARRKAEADLADLNKKFDGIDPEAARAAAAAVKTREEEDLRKAGDFDRLKERMATEHARETEALKTANKKMADDLAANKSVVERLTLGAEFATSTFIKDELTLTPNKAKVIYGPYFEIEGTEVVGYDKPVGDQGRTKLVDASGTPFKFEEALKRLVEADPDRDQIVKSKAKPGASSSPGPGGKPKPDEIKVVGVNRIAALLNAAQDAKK